MKRQIIRDDVYNSGEDHSAHGLNTIEAVGNLAADVAGYPHHYAAVTVSAPAATVVRINPGRLYAAGKVYDLDQPVDVDLQPRLTQVSGDTVWVALLLRGKVDVIRQQRQVLIDADTEETDVQQVEVAEHFTMEGIVQAGIPGPTPLKPTVAETECIVAWVLLSNASVAAIEMHPAHRVRSLYEVEGRLTILEFRFAELVQTVATLRTDLSAVAAAQRDAVRRDVFAQALLDISALRRETRILENEPRAYLYDPGLVNDKWDTDHPMWVARVAEGIRFEFVQLRDDRLELYDAANSDIVVVDGMLLPRYEEVVKLSVEGGTQSKNMSQLVHTEVRAVQREVSRSSTSYGPIVTVCENTKDWERVGTAAKAGKKLAVKGETFKVVGLSTNTRSANWNADPRSDGHKNYDVQKVSTTSWTETYWDYVSEEFGLNGSVYGQTWLNSQMQILTAIRLRFTRVGSSGDAHLVVCECSDDGEPELDKVIYRSTVLHANLAAGKVRFPLRPSLLEPGRRYAWFMVTTGNHQIAYVENNKFAEGSMFQMSDGAWAQGSITEDFEFDLMGAKFLSTRTKIEFQPLNLPGGMTYVRLITPGWAPEGTQALWQFKLPGDDQPWRNITPENADTLYAQPEGIRLRMVMVGTTDLSPALLLGATARSEVGRTQGLLRARTELIQFGVSTNRIVVDLMIDQWVDAQHTATVRLLIGATEYTATAVSIWQDPDKPKRRRLSAVFTGLPSTTSAIVLLEGTKTGVDEWFGESLFVMAT
ncbi:hypothetical protein [Devosia sp. 1635]|uniref:hypothetical protein n=1 Tax=Devosia sp. 1635 TaxID=2726066 RepID=UPI001567216C|nr:hypothetical protein [Devosia sp. 1635]